MIGMFGLLQIRVGRKTLKEAVPLELVRDRGTDTFLTAFKRFTSLRGNPNNCWSDCGTTFIGAQHYLKELCKNRTSQKSEVPFVKKFLVRFTGTGMFHEPAIKMV